LVPVLVLLVAPLLEGQQAQSLAGFLVGGGVEMSSSGLPYNVLHQRLPPILQQAYDVAMRPTIAGMYGFPSRPELVSDDPAEQAAETMALQRRPPQKALPPFAPTSARTPDFLPPGGYTNIEPRQPPQPSARDEYRRLTQEGRPQPEEPKWYQRLGAAALGAGVGWVNTSPSSARYGPRIPWGQAARTVEGILRPNYGRRVREWEESVTQASEQARMDQEERNQELREQQIQAQMDATAARQAETELRTKQLGQPKPQEFNTFEEYRVNQLKSIIESRDSTPEQVAKAQSELEKLTAPREPTPQRPSESQRNIEWRTSELVGAGKPEDEARAQAISEHNAREMRPPAPNVALIQYRAGADTRQKADSYFAQAFEQAVDVADQFEKAIDMARRAGESLETVTELQKRKNERTRGERQAGDDPIDEWLKQIAARATGAGQPTTGRRRFNLETGQIEDIPPGQ
jgi:hypothetical protein